jgi:HEAT repeat protein
VRSAVTFWLTAALIALAVVPALWVLGREAFQRVQARRALRKVVEAQKIIEGAAQGDVGALVKSLTEQFDPRTNERVVLTLLRSTDEGTKKSGSRLFGELGLVDVYAKRLRNARRWSEREHAAETLGLAGLAQAVPALVESLRDRHEDEASVKSAASTALARLRDATAIPLLVQELARVDEHSSRNVAEAIVGFGAMATPALLELLIDPAYAAARVWAARILGRIGDPGAVDDLIARLSDRDDRLRMAAAEALGAIRDPRALQALVRATLRDPAPQVRAHAAGAVAHIEGERAVDVMVAALADPDYATRIRALEAFETMRVADTSPLEAALRDPNAEVRRRAALALERVGYLERVVTQLTAQDQATRTRAYAALTLLGEVGMADSVASYVHDASFEVRAIAARACGDLGVTRLAPVLMRAIDDEAWPVRAAVCEALGRLKHDDAPLALIRALSDAEESVREAAAEALTNYAPDLLARHVESFAATYELGSVVVRRSLVVIAGRIHETAADALLVRAASDPSDAVRLPAVVALGERPDEVKVDPLVARLTDASLDVRMAAVTALGSVARTDAFEGLLRALPGAPPEVRDRIADALARGTRASLLDRLPELERSESLDVRLGVAWTLGKIGDAKGVPTLARFLRDGAAALRASAAGALAKIAHPSARDALFAAAGDPDGRVRAAVVNALARFGGGESRTIAALEVRMRDPDPFVRNRALIALASAGGAAVEDRVRALGGSANLAARTVALALIGSREALTSVFEVLAQGNVLDTVLSFLDHEDPRVRVAFFGALKLDDPTRSGEALGDGLNVVAQYERTLRTSLEAGSRRVAVEGLARLGLERAVPVLCDAATGDPNESVRLRAARALADNVSDDGARQALIRAVADPNAEVAIAAARALASRREPEVVSALEARLGAGAEELQEVIESTLADLHRDDPFSFVDWMMGVEIPDLLAPAVRVLARMASPAMLPLFSQLVRSRSALVRAETVRALAQLPFPDIAPLIEEKAQDPSEDVRLAVVDAVGSTTDALTRLAMLRRDPSARVRARAATALERLKGPGARAAHRALEAMLEDSSPVVRAAALASLAGSRDPDGLRVFGDAWASAALDARLELRIEARAAALSDRLAIRLTSSPDPRERRCAVIALGAFAASGFQTQVAPALRDPSPDVRIAAVQALGSVDDPVIAKAIAEMVADPEGAVREAARRTLVRSAG